MNRRKRTELEQNIVASLQAYRLKREIEIIDAEASGQVDGATEEKKKGLKAFIKSALSGAKAEIIQGRGKRDIEEAKANYSNFISSLPEGVSASLCEDEEAFANLIHVYFDRDEGSAKISMALELLALESDPNAVKYLRKDKSRKALSAFFMDDASKLDEIGLFFDKAYAEIASTKPNSFSRGFLYGLTAGSIAMLGPRLLTMIFHIKTDAFPIKKLVGESAKALAASELLMLSTLVGGGYLNTRRYRKKTFRKLRSTIREALDSEIAYSFATAITLWKFNHQEENQDAKEDLDLIVKMVDDVRADAEYLTLVEKEEQKENLKKILVCNNAIAFISSIRM